MSSCTGGKVDNEKLDPDNLEASFPGKFTYEDLHKLGFIEFEHAEENDLTEPVLELFCNWKDLNRDQRVVLDPVLRLASSMVRSSASVRFIHNVMYGKRTYLEKESMLNECAIYELALPPCYIRKTFEQFVDGLDDLKQLVMWNVADLPEGIAAETVTNMEEPRPFRGCGIDIRWGFSTNIFIEKRVFQSLHELQIGAQSTGDKTTQNEVSVRNLKLRLQYWFAVTLCHELVHAINQAVSEDREPFYGNQKYAELGYAWENDCLGGRLMSLRGFRGPDPFVTVKWPSLNLIPPEDSEETGRGHPKGSATRYYVPMDYMARVQRQKTWDAYASPDQAPLNALHIPKLVGVQSYDKKQKTFDPLWKRAESSEGRWPGGRHGRVWRAAYLKERVADSISVEESSELSWLLERTPTSPDSISHTVISSLTDAVETYMRYLDEQESLKERALDSIMAEESSKLSSLLERTPTSLDSVSYVKVVKTVADPVATFMRHLDKQEILKERVPDDITIEEISDLSPLLERTPTSPDNTSHTIVHKSVTDPIENFMRHLDREEFHEDWCW